MEHTVHVHHHFPHEPDPQLDRIEQYLEVLARRMGHIDREGDFIMLDLAALQAEVAENTDATLAAGNLLGQLSTQIRDAAGDPAAIAAIADQLDANNAALSAAVTANTPAAAQPPVDEAPPVDVPPAGQDGVDEPTEDVPGDAGEQPAPEQPAEPQPGQPDGEPSPVDPVQPAEPGTDAPPEAPDAPPVL